jgi:DNA-binding CsgD family transcriptional regulator
LGEGLTLSEREVLLLLTAGFLNEAIAHELVVAVAIIKRHVSNIMRKVGVQSRLAAIARARPSPYPSDHRRASRRKQRPTLGMSAVILFTKYTCPTSLFLPSRHHARVSAVH